METKNTNPNDDFSDLEDLSTYEATPVKKPEDSTTIFKELFEYLKLLAIAIAVALIINNFVIVNAQVPTGSMNSTILEGDRIIGFRLSYLFSKPERGDIIIFRYPDDESQNFVKRVIGLPGDTVVIENGIVYVNGEILEEPYLNEPMYGSFGPYFVPEGCYFVLGDNRNDSRDSRYWVNTYVTSEQILAKAIFKYYKNFAMLK